MIGVDAESVEHVVVTHLHYDHAGNIDKFPKARFYLQEREMAYATGDHRAALFVSGLALMSLVFVLAGLAWRWSGGRVHA